MALSAALYVSRPFAAAGAVTRLITQGMYFARGRGWAWLISRTRIDFRSEVGDPATNSIVGAVTGWIARNFPEAPVAIVRESDPGGTPIARSSSGAGRFLRLLEKPNKYFSGVVLWQATVLDFLRGDAYWIKIRSARGLVIEYWWIPRQMMEPRWDETDPSAFIGWYEYTVDGVIYTIRVQDVVHFRNGIDPLNPRKGRDQLGSLFREIFTDEEAAAFTASLLRNLGVPGVIISPANTTTGRPLDVDPAGIKEKFGATFGGDGRGEPLVLTAPTEVKVLSWNPQQMDLKALRRIPEERVSAVLGVPAGVAQLGAGLDRNTFTNYGEGNRAAYTQGIKPLHRVFAAELELQALPDFVGQEIDDLDVIFDTSQVAAFAEWQATLEKAAREAASKGLLKRSDYLRATGRKPAADGSDDVYLLANNIVMVPAGGGRVVPALPPAGPPAGPPALGPGRQPAGLLESGAPVGSEVRCTGCRRLLAELAAPPYRFTCRCGVVTEQALEEAA